MLVMILEGKDQSNIILVRFFLLRCSYIRFEKDHAIVALRIEDRSIIKEL
ncbi:MAG: hypothetical protein ACI86M_002577 [Saprospiraceae bacterium]|jgi:hypothetical protein